MNEKKYKSIVVIWGAILLILQVLSLINIVGINPEKYTSFIRILTALIATVMLTLSIIFMVLSLEKKKSGPIIGLILGVIYSIGSALIVSINYIYILSAIFGIAFILYNISLLKSLQQKTVVEK